MDAGARGVATRVLLAKGRVLAALGVLGDHVESHFRPAEAVQILQKPIRSVLAAMDFAPGELLLAPDTNNVQAIATSEYSEEASRQALRVAFQPPHPSHVFLLNPCAANDNVSACWCVAGTEDADKANMCWDECVVQTVTGLDFLGPVKPTPPPLLQPLGTDAHAAAASSSIGPDGAGDPPVPAVRCRGKVSARATAAKASAKAAAARTVDEAYQESVRIPVLVNKEQLRKGEELLIHRQKAAKRAKPPEAISVTKLARKAMQA